MKTDLVEFVTMVTPEDILASFPDHERAVGILPRAAAAAVRLSGRPSFRSPSRPMSPIDRERQARAWLLKAVAVRNEFAARVARRANRKATA